MCLTHLSPEKIHLNKIFKKTEGDWPKLPRPLIFTFQDYQLTIARFTKPGKRLVSFRIAPLRLFSALLKVIISIRQRQSNQDNQRPGPGDGGNRAYKLSSNIQVNNQNILLKYYKLKMSLASQLISSLTIKTMNKQQEENNSFARSSITETPARKPSKNCTVLRNVLKNKVTYVSNSCL